MWPMWVHALIARYWSALEAQALQHAVMAAAAPHAKPGDYRALLASLEASAALLNPPRAVVQPMPKERIDPAAAAEWFAAQGIRVVTSG